MLQFVQVIHSNRNNFNFDFECFKPRLLDIKNFAFRILNWLLQFLDHSFVSKSFIPSFELVYENKGFNLNCKKLLRTSDLDELPCKRSRYELISSNKFCSPVNGKIRYFDFFKFLFE